MPASLAFDYAVVRVVPRVEREEFVNTGVILHCPAQRFLDCRLELDERRLRALDPAVDLDAIYRQLEALRAVCAGAPDGGPMAHLSPSERFHWLVAPKSTVVQTSPLHAGLCTDPASTLEHLFQTIVAGPDRG